MKSLAWGLAGALAAAAVFAQDNPRPTQPALPPPGIHDPGVRPASAPAPSASAPSRQPALPSSGLNEDKPDVRVYDRGGDSVQEYRRSGQVYMVVVTPKGGVPQTYMVDAQGRLTDEHGQKPVGPVMYKLMEWGKSRSAEGSSSGP